MTQHQAPLEPGLMYHIWTHANGNEILFCSEENYKYFWINTVITSNPLQKLMPTVNAESSTPDGENQRGRSDSKYI